MEEAPVPPSALPFIVIAYKHNDGELIKRAGGNRGDLRDALKTPESTLTFLMAVFTDAVVS